MKRLICAVALAATLACIGNAKAQDWPTRPVTMVVPYAAGGPVDTIGRILASRLGEVLGQQVIVENVGGAGGMTGANRVAKAAPDGYTFLLGGPPTLAQMQSLYKKPLYNATIDFAPVALFADSARILITRKDLPANTLAEFIAYAKEHQTKMQYGSSGSSSGLHICAVLLNLAMGTHITHVPYRGSAPAMQDMIAGRIDFMCEQVSTAFPQIQAGTVKAIATLGPTRSAVLADLPTAPEQGLADLDCNTWSALVFPKGTPQAIVRRLANATSEAVDSKAVHERFESVGVTVVAPERRSPEYLSKYIPSEIERWARPIKASGESVD
ncbi:MAG: Bug family tripartite tricarboxylate transporter substrate binding protein [Xanthobacteraceae bacterium]